MGSEKPKMITKAAVAFNGITIAYAMGLANALFGCLLAFGVHLNDQEIASLLTLLNAVLILSVHIGHRVGEATASGAAGASSRRKLETVAVAAERRGLELHDQEQEPPTPITDAGQG